MDHKIKLMEYLYGEMDASAKEEFEQLLKTDEALQKELDTMQKTRSFLATDRDLVPQGKVQIVSHSGIGKNSIFRSKWFTMAASLLMLLIAGKLLDIRMVAKSGEFVVQFGDRVESPKDDMLQMIREELKTEHQFLELQLASFQQQLEQKLESPAPEIQKGFQTQFASYNRQIKNLKTDLEVAQADRYNTFMDQMQRDQKQYSKELMQGMFQFVEAQRQEDLKLISQGFKNLSRAIQLGEDYAQFANQPLQKF